MLVNTDRFWGFRKSGVVTRFGVLPAEVLANSRLPPSREVMGIVPLDARAVAKIEKLVYLVGELSYIVAMSLSQKKINTNN